MNKTFNLILTDIDFTCDFCDKHFKNVSARNYHVKDCHPLDENQKRCTLCNKLFSAISTRARHEEVGCPQERKIIWIPPEEVNKEKVNFRHTSQRNTISEVSTQILDLFRAYLTDGGTSTFMLSRGKQKLESSSVESYISHFRVYIAFIEVR